MASTSFKEKYQQAVSDQQLQRNLLSFQRGWRQSRAERFKEFVLPDGASGEAAFQELRQEMAKAKDTVIAAPDRYFEQFKEAAERSGAIVYQAQSAEDAAQYILDLCTRAGTTLMVKTKSMVSEEIYLNHVLEEHGIRAVETDLGEWIVQLRHETPSHMVMPAIHLSRQQVGQTFTEATGRPVSKDDVGEQVGLARSELRKDFLAAKVGMTGANALIAESGSAMVITNEGNEAMVSTLPQIQVILVGYEKLVATFEDAVTQLRLLPRSATGQNITTYVTFFTGPDRLGRELHYVFVDNGRSTMRADPNFVDALRCIRCAACANVCPPYQVVGGHVFGYIYTGPIGLVNTPFHHGLDADAGPQSLCVSCNACASICPAEIPLPRQILDVRQKVVAANGLSRAKRMVLTIWSRPRLFRALLRTAGVLTRPFTRDGTIRLPLPRRYAWRALPAIATQPARARLTPVTEGATSGRLANSGAKGLTVAYFIQCLTDQLAVEQAEATVNVLTACGARVVVPDGQHCCGLPMIDSGDVAGGKPLAKQTITLLEAVTADYIVSAANSCVVAIAHDYAHLFQDEPEWKARAERLSPRVLDLATFLTTVAKLAPGSLAQSGQADSMTYHPFCQTLNVLHADQAAMQLLQSVCGLSLTQLPEASVCCGFGGSTSFDAPEVGKGIVDRKLKNVDATGASVLVTDNPGCVLHLRGAARASGRRLKVMHFAELLAARLPAEDGR